MTNDTITTDKNEEKALPPTNTEDFDLLDLFQRVSKILGRGNAANISIPERPGQVRVLALLDDADNGKMSQRDMLDKLDIRSASLSEILRKLEVKKHVIRRRDPLDKRGIIVEITEAGHIVLCESEMERDQAQTELFSSLSDEQKVQLAKTLKTLLDTWEESGLSTEASKDEKASHTHSHGDDGESKQWQHGKRENAARKPGNATKPNTGKRRAEQRPL